MQHFCYGSQRRGPVLQMCESQSINLGVCLVTLNLSAWLGWRLVLPHPSPLLKNGDSETMGFGKVTQLSTPMTPASPPPSAPALWPRAGLIRKEGRGEGSCPWEEAAAPAPAPSFDFTLFLLHIRDFAFFLGNPMVNTDLNSFQADEGIGPVIPGLLSFPPSRLKKKKKKAEQE